MLDLAFPMGWGAGTPVPAQPPSPLPAGVPADALPVDEVVAIFDALVAELAGHDMEGPAVDIDTAPRIPDAAAGSAEVPSPVRPVVNLAKVMTAQHDGADAQPIASPVSHAAKPLATRHDDLQAELTSTDEEPATKSDDPASVVIAATIQVKSIDVDVPRHRIELLAGDLPESIIASDAKARFEQPSDAPEDFERGAPGLETKSSPIATATLVPAHVSTREESAKAHERRDTVSPIRTASGEVQQLKAERTHGGESRLNERAADGFETISTPGVPASAQGPAPTRPVTPKPTADDAPIAPNQWRPALTDVPAAATHVDPAAIDASASLQALPVRPSSRLNSKDGAGKSAPAIAVGKAAVSERSEPFATAPIVFPRPVVATPDASRERPSFDQPRHVPFALAGALHGATLQYARHQQFEIAAASPLHVADQAALPTATSDQIVQSLRLALTRDGGEARITLNPREFGDLTVTVKVEQGAVVARMHADTPAVREWLQQNQDTLRTRLADQELRLDRLDVAAAQESSESRQDADARRRDPHADERPRPRRPSQSTTFEVVA